MFNLKKGIYGIFLCLNEIILCFVFGLRVFLLGEDDL